MNENPDETPKVQLPSPEAMPTKRRWRIALLVVLFNAFLALLFPPVWKPLPCFYGIQSIGRSIQPYLLLLGFPATFVGDVSPDAIREHPCVYMIAYAANMVVVSYFLGQFVSGLITMRKPSIQTAGKERSPTARSRGFWKIRIQGERVAVLLVVVSATLFGGLLAYVTITRPAYDRLDYGMSMEEAKAIMGQPQTEEEKDEAVIWSYPYPQSRTPDFQIELRFDDGILVGVSDKPGGGKGSACPWGDKYQLNKAIAVWSDVIRLNPTDVKAYRNRGEAYMSMGFWRDVGYFHDEDIVPGRAPAHYRAAIADYSEAIRLNSKDAKAYIGRADVYSRTGEEDKANADRAKAKELNALE